MTSCRRVSTGVGKVTGSISIPLTNVDWASTWLAWWHSLRCAIMSWARPPLSARPRPRKLSPCAACCARLCKLLGQAIPQITPRPIMTQGDLRNPSMFASFLTWQPVFNRPVAEQMALYQQPEFREAFRQELISRKRDHIWGQTRVLEVHNP